MRLRAAFATCALMAGAAACSLIVDTGDLGGGAAPTGPDGSTASDGATPDAPRDAAQKDSQAPADGSAPIDGGRDAPGNPCTGALLCDDFEGPPHPLWVPITSNGVVEIDKVRPASGARSLHGLRLTGTAGFAAYRASLPTKYLSCELDAYAEGVTSPGEVIEVFTFEWAVGGIGGGPEPLYVYLTPGGVEMGELLAAGDGGRGGGSVGSPLPGGGINKWIHLKASVDAGGRARLTATPEGGSPVALTKAIQSSASASATLVYAGMVYANLGPTPTVFIDNVVCTKL